MSKPKLKEARSEEVPEYVPEGLRNGGHVYPRCSNCQALLMDVFITRPHESDVWKIRAKCPWCGDHSFIETFKGGFHPGGYGSPKEDDPNDDIPSTCVDHWDVEGDVVVFTIMKANVDAKPVYRQ